MIIEPLFFVVLKLRSWFDFVYLDVSKNGGTQQPWVFLLKLIILGCFGGTPIVGNTHLKNCLTPNIVGEDSMIQFDHTKPGGFFKQSPSTEIQP